MPIVIITCVGGLGKQEKFQEALSRAVGIPPGERHSHLVGNGEVKAHLGGKVQGINHVEVHALSFVPGVLSLADLIGGSRSSEVNNADILPWLAGPIDVTRRTKPVDGVHDGLTAIVRGLPPKLERGPGSVEA